MLDGHVDGLAGRSAGVIAATARVAFFAGLLAVIVLCLLPAEALPPVPLWDKFEHFAAYGMLAAAGGVGYPTRGARAKVVLCLLALGVGIEVAQGFVPGREASAMDMLANAIGAVTGVLTATGFCAVMLRRPASGA